MNARQRRKLTRAMQRKAEAMKLHNVVEDFTDACLLRASLRDMRWIFRATPRKRAHSREGRHRLRQIVRLQDISPRLRRLQAERLRQYAEGVVKLGESVKDAGETMARFGESAKLATEALEKMPHLGQP